MVVAVLSIAGVQVPSYPLLEVVGKSGISQPEQKGPAWSKVGVSYTKLQGSEHDITASHPAYCTLTSEVNLKVRDPSAAVDVTVPGDVLPVY